MTSIAPPPGRGYVAQQTNDGWRELSKEDLDAHLQPYRNRLLAWNKELSELIRRERWSVKNGQPDAAAVSWTLSFLAGVQRDIVALDALDSSVCFRCETGNQELLTLIDRLIALGGSWDIVTITWLRCVTTPISKRHQVMTLEGRQSDAVQLLPIDLRPQCGAIPRQGC